GLQTGLDIVATFAWWDWNAESVEADEDEVEAQAEAVFTTGSVIAILASFIVTVAAVYIATKSPKEELE
ncbi:MAG: hypothetical protein OR994_06075, partial [Candidatus Poseidoniales archaeon]|nr:hypothetical protein [Candidatus Poseidoniales archaeon]